MPTTSMPWGKLGDVSERANASFDDELSSATSTADTLGGFTELQGLSRLYGLLGPARCHQKQPHSTVSRGPVSGTERR